MERAKVERTRRERTTAKRTGGMERRSDEMAAASPSVAARVRRAERSRAAHALAPPARDAPRGRGLPETQGRMKPQPTGATHGRTSQRRSSYPSIQSRQPPPHAGVAGDGRTVARFDQGGRHHPAALRVRDGWWIDDRDWRPPGEGVDQSRTSADRRAGLRCRRDYGRDASPRRESDPRLDVERGHLARDRTARSAELEQTGDRRCARLCRSVPCAA